MEHAHKHCTLAHAPRANSRTQQRGIWICNGKIEKFSSAKSTQRTNIGNCFVFFHFISQIFSNKKKKNIILFVFVSVYALSATPNAVLCLLLTTENTIFFFRQIGVVCLLLCALCSMNRFSTQYIEITRSLSLSLFRAPSLSLSLFANACSVVCCL